MISWYKVGRKDYAIFLYTDFASIDFVRKNIEPYYTINKVELLSEVFDSSYWKIINGPNDFKIKNDKIDVIRSEQKDLKEPTRKFFVVANKKMINLVEPVDTKWRNQIIIRLIRDIFRNYFFRYDNMSFFHGGLIKFKNFGIAFLGEKKTGKTSSILSCLKYGNADYVTNDDISIQIIDNKICGFGWPRTISVRNDTFDVIDLDRASILKQLEHPSNSTNWNKVATFVYPKELEQLFNVKVISKSEIKYIVFPIFDENIYDPNLRKLNDIEFKEMLKLNLEQDIDKHFKDFQSYFSSDNISTDDKVIENIAQKCTGYILNQNFNNLKKSIELIKKELM